MSTPFPARVPVQSFSPYFVTVHHQTTTNAGPQQCTNDGAAVCPAGKSWAARQETLEGGGWAALDNHALAECSGNGRQVVAHCRYFGSLYAPLPYSSELSTSPTVYYYIFVPFTLGFCRPRADATEPTGRAYALLGLRATPAKEVSTSFFTSCYLIRNRRGCRASLVDSVTTR